MFNGQKSFGGNQFNPPAAMMNPMGTGMEVKEVQLAQATPGQVYFAKPSAPAARRDQAGRRPAYVSYLARPWRR
jgi:hypothetical protein